MKLGQAVEILVCVRCRPQGASSDEPRAGLSLFEAVQEEAFKLDTQFAVRPIECMSACKRSCAVALQSPGKITYLFGDLAADSESAQQIVMCAQMYHAESSGIMARAARPERMREGILARLPAPTCAAN